MPQLDSTTFFSQLAITIFFFAVLFIFMAVVVLPSVYKAQRARDLAITESELQLNVIFSMLWLTDAYKQITSDKVTNSFDNLINVAIYDVNEFPTGLDEDRYIYDGVGIAEYDELSNSDWPAEILRVIGLVAHDFSVGYSYENDVFIDLLLEEYGLFSNLTVSNYELQAQILQSDDDAKDLKLYSTTVNADTDSATDMPVVYERQNDAIIILDSELTDIDDKTE